MRRRTIFLLVLATLGAMAGAGRAEEGPIVIAHRDAHPYLSLDPFHGSVELTGIYEMDHSRSSGGSSSASDALFTQQLTLGSGGYIVSPNLFKWTASGTIAAEEDWSHVGTTSSSSVGYFDAYNLDLDILSGTQYPINVFANRSEAFVNRTFAGMLRNTITSYGANLQYRSPTLPLTLNAVHTTTAQTDLAGHSQYTIDQNNLNFSTSIQPWERHNLTFNYSFGTVAQNNPGGGAGTVSNSSQLQAVSINHDWSIDPLARYTLSQAFNYSQQTGTYDETRLRLAEQLRMRLSDTLDGSLNYTLEQQKYLSSDATSHLVTANLTHRLFESLTTTGRVGASLTDNTYAGGTSTNTKNYFASVGTSYNKKMFMGRLGANLSLGISENQSGAIGTTQQVLGDVQSFNDPQPIILTRTGVNSGSVAVFDASGTRRYVQGIDYTVQKVGNTVRIERLIGGNINSGDTVRLNYGIDPLPGFSSESLSFGAGANYAFDEGWLKGLNLYTRYYQVDQSISPATSGILPDNIRDTTIGAEYRIWKLTLRAEDEIRQSTLAPYDAQRLSAGYIDNIGQRGTLSVNLTQNFIHMPEDRSSTSSTSLDGRFQYQISRDLKAAVTARWLNQSYNNRPGSTGLEEQAELHWNIRQTEMYLILRHSSLDAQDTNLGTLSLQFGITRNF